MKLRKPGTEKFGIAISLDELKDSDVLPLIDVLMASDDGPRIDAVDILHETRCGLRDECLMALLFTVDSKLRIVDLHEMSLRNELLRSVLETLSWQAFFPNSISIYA